MLQWWIQPNRLHNIEVHGRGDGNEHYCDESESARTLPSLAIEPVTALLRPYDRRRLLAACVWSRRGSVIAKNDAGMEYLIDVLSMLWFAMLK